MDPDVSGSEDVVRYLSCLHLIIKLYNYTGACNVNGSIQFKGNEKLKIRLCNVLSTPRQMSETYRTSDM